MFYIEFATMLFLGLVLGSFSTALIHRVPKRIPWGAERSACPKCKTSLSALDLIPVLSWCLSSGKCRHCKSEIHFSYPLTELLSGILCVLIYLVYGLNVSSLFLVAAVPFLIALCLIDLRHMILPNQLIVIMLMLGCARLSYMVTIDGQSSLSDNMWLYLFGACVYAFTSWFLGFVLTRILKRNSLGFGDVKFFMVAGLWLGVLGLPYFMILSGTMAIVFSLGWRMVLKQEVFPFGPSLIVSLYLLLLFQGFYSF